MTAVASLRQIVIQRVQLDHGELERRLAENPAKAACAIGDAARRGIITAQLVYGQLLLDGRGVERDPQRSLWWFERAAEAGDPEARNMVGRCYERGWGVPQDYGIAARHFGQAARQGHVWAKVNLAQILTRLGDPADRPRALALFHQAAGAGNLKAMNSLARFLEEGWGTPPDPAAAARLYRIAAKRGDHWAKVNLATLLWQQDRPGDALALIADAIGASDAGFCRRLGPLLLARPDVTLRRLGLDALARAAAKGTAEDEYRYALALAAGLAGPPDPVVARRWFGRAADRGHGEARKRCRRARTTFLSSNLKRRAARGLLEPLR